MAVKNKSASVLARLRNQAREEDINYQTCLQLFVQEEFLRRLSRSTYRDNLILKAGVFDRIEKFNQNSNLQIRWKAFGPVKETGLQFKDVLDVLTAFLRPVTDSISDAKEFTLQWSCSAGKWEE